MRPVSAAFAAVSLMVCSASAMAKDDEGTVIALRNRAEACSPAATCRNLDFGSKVLGGDSLKTYERSRLTVRFASGSRLDMGPNSVLVMASLQADGKSTFARWGEFDFEVKKPDSKGRFKVRTPVAVAGAEGTRFRVEVDTLTGDSRLRLDEGSLTITPDDPGLPVFQMRSGQSLEMKLGSLPILRNLDGSLSTTVSGTRTPDIQIVPVPQTLVPQEQPSHGTLRIEVVP
ncbi:MAG TPA: FecR family protein [Fibrobacteria bacterium]|nr:FecR family protein [Fibrobacteria bacterium]